MPLFRQRMGAFLADNERGNRIGIRLCLGQESKQPIFRLKRSHADGHFFGSLELPMADYPELAKDTWANFRALTKPNDSRCFDGRFLLLPPEGLSVISDIDDTIKISEVFDTKRLLHNTFLKEYADVPEMAALYRHWAESRHAAFHYVSASPWHLYPFLAEFLSARQFPPGTFHLRHFRLMGSDLVGTLRPSRRVKARHARELLERFPHRRFLLVGDSGESDPAIYVSLARRFPRQVARIFIRNVTGEPPSANRWKRTFAGLPTTQWQVFTSTGEICDP
jgi:hypothetical protein